MAKENMAFDWDASNVCFKRQYRWAFSVSDFIGIEINMLPPLKSSRPSISFKEMPVEHVSETIYFPGKPDFKPVNVTLFDFKTANHPVMAWIKKIYSPKDGFYGFSGNGFKIPQADLVLYDGCGKEIEKWVYENAWIQEANFGELDYDQQSAIVTCDISIRYDRAYIQSNEFIGDINTNNDNIA